MLKPIKCPFKCKKSMQQLVRSKKRKYRVEALMRSVVYAYFLEQAQQEIDKTPDQYTFNIEAFKVALNQTSPETYDAWFYYTCEDRKKALEMHQEAVETAQGIIAQTIKDGSQTAMLSWAMADIDSNTRWG